MNDILKHKIGYIFQPISVYFPQFLIDCFNYIESYSIVFNCRFLQKCAKPIKYNIKITLNTENTVTIFSDVSWLETVGSP
jgi:hypothetical protein